MVVLGGVAVSYERGTPVAQLWAPREVGFPASGYRGILLIRCRDSENGRWRVLDFKNVLEKRSVVRS